MTEKVIEPRLGPYTGDAVAEPTDVVPDEERRGLKFALYGFLGALAVILLITLPPGAPLRNETTGAIFGDSPFMTGILVIISIFFGVAGYAYGKGAGTMTSSVEAINGVVKTYSGLAGLIFLLLIIAQFIAFFNYTNIATVLAVNLADWLEAAGLGAVPLLVGFVLVTALLDIIIPGVIPKWAIFAPIFIPLFLRLDIAAPARAGGLPRRRLAVQRRHAADGLLRGHRGVRPALREERRGRHGRVADDPVHVRAPPRLDRVPRRLVPARDPARTGSARAPDVTSSAIARPRRGGA